MSHPTDQGSAGHADRPGASHKPPPNEDPLDRDRFPIDPWRLVETGFSSADLGVTETVFSVGNGYLGLRGNYEESRDFSSNGTFVNGFHETWPIQHAEEAFGFAKVGQTIVNAPDAKVIRLYVDDEPLELSSADLVEYERALDFRNGRLTRHLVWRTPSGKLVQVDSTRMVSFTQRHLALITFEVTVLGSSAPITISSQLINRQDVDLGGLDRPEPPAGADTDAKGADLSDPRKAGAIAHRVLISERDDSADGTPDELPENRIALRFRCADSGMTIAVAAEHHLETDNHATSRVERGDDLAKTVFNVRAEPDVPIRLTKLVSYHTSARVPSVELLDRCGRTLDRAVEIGLPGLLTEQHRYLEDFWARSDVEIEGQDAVQQAVRWNLFSLAQATARADGKGIPAKGVTGSGYGGHYFWDTEIYVLPFLSHTTPWAARNALRFRHGLLDAARERAAMVSQKGALFAWRTINGQEASAYYAAGTAQYHIDADISYALSQYVDVTGDLDFLNRQGIDVLVETARMWQDLGFFLAEDGGAFHIHGVTGPDEYTTVVNDNLYTNVMARHNLRRAAHAVRYVQEHHHEMYEALVRRVGLGEDEAEEWDKCAEAMTIPFDQHLGVHPQDLHFLEREMWDLDHTPPTARPLLLHYHPLVIYRFQVLKQADVVLALFLQGEEFSLEEKRADFSYYDPITTGDSTLSAVVQSIIAAEVGYQDLALRYFVGSLFVDLADRHSNASDGVHVASTGGVWTGLVCGFGGYRCLGPERYRLDPRLPESWSQLRFRLTIRGVRVRVEVRRDELELLVEDGDGEVTFEVRGEPVTVAPGPATVVPLPDQGPVLEGGPEHAAGHHRSDGTRISAMVPTPGGSH